MLVSTLERKQSHRFQCHDAPTLDNHLGHKLPKFSLNLKKYCSIHLRLLQSLNEDRRHDIFMLNPECHLKFLEENLNFLSKKPSRCNDFKISSTKSNSCGVKTLSENRFPSLAFTPIFEDCVPQTKQIEGKFDNGSSRDTVIFDRPKIKVTSVSLQKQQPNKPLFPTPPIIKIKQKYSNKNDTGHELQANLKCKPVSVEKTSESLKSKTENDSQFEFTVAGEKIVSFVCSPPSSRRPKIKESENNYICDSDEESIVSSSKGSSESAPSSNSSNSGYSKSKVAPPMREHVKTNMLLWHPPPTSKSAVSLSESKMVYKGSSYSQPIKPKPSENSINFFGSINSMYAISSASDQSLRISHNQETVKFREAALRGCYDIENLLKEIKCPLPDLEKEVSSTREEIFSAVRLQRDNTNLVSDSILSVIDICKSWIKLNAHFGQQDFKNFLEINGLDLTILGDFVQWQCMSRIFVDKLINVLKKVSLRKDLKVVKEVNSTQMRGSEIATVHSYLSLTNENVSNTIPCVQNLNISPPAHGKRWKQRRFLSEKIDSEKAVLTKNQYCRKNVSLCDLYQNSQLVNNTTSESVFGQGVNSQSVIFDIPEINHLFPNKTYQSAQTDMSLLLNGSKPLNCSNLGFFDKNISVSTPKCFSRSEASLRPITPANNMFTSLTNVIDSPLINFFPVQQGVPTVPPVYNNQLCLLSPNQYQPCFSHCLAKPNPILCVDTDVSDNFMQSNYMKPGHYTPPQKPESYQKPVNNTIPIEDLPLVGIPFLYSAPSTPQQSKSFEFPQMLMSKDSSQSKDSDVIWKTALSMAAPLRDTMIADNTIDGPNLKISETVSQNLNFFFSDNSSQDSSSSGDYLKVNSDSDELSFPGDSYAGKDLRIMKSKNETAGWLIDPFKQVGVGNENSIRSTNEHERFISENEMAEVSQISDKSKKLKEKEPYFPSCHSRGNDQGNSFCNKNEDKLSSHKKSRKSKKQQNSYTINDHTASMFYNKIFARPINNKMTCQLEEIVDILRNTKASSLIKEEILSEEEMARLDLNVSNRLPLQAIRHKLSNHTYDTLDQALADLQQYLVDIRSKIQGDKQSIEAVSALEQMFYGLVEKHFGPKHQAPTQYVKYVNNAPTSKMRRQKKTPRRL